MGMTDPRDQMQAKQGDTRTRTLDQGGWRWGRLVDRTVNQLADRFWEFGFRRRKELRQPSLSVEMREEKKER